MAYRFRDILTASVQAEILTFWGLQGLGILTNIPGEVNGALISVFTLMFQFYFRKRPSDEKVKETVAV